MSMNWPLSGSVLIWLVSGSVFSMLTAFMTAGGSPGQKSLVVSALVQIKKKLKSTGTNKQKKSSKSERTGSHKSERASTLTSG